MVFIHFFILLTSIGYIMSIVSSTIQYIDPILSVIYGVIGVGAYLIGKRIISNT